MSRSVLVSRGELSLPDLQLWDPPNLFVPEDGFGPGAGVRRRHTTQSPFIPKRKLVSSVLDIQQGQIQVQCRAATGGALRTLVEDVVLEAFAQTVYSVTFNYDGYTGTWTSCEPADFAVGKAGIFDEFDLAFYEQLVSLQVWH